MPIAFLCVCVWKVDVVAQGGNASQEPQENQAGLAQPNFEDVVLIDDVFDVPSSWSYRPDSPDPPIQPINRNVSIEVPGSTKAFALSAAPFNLVGALEVSRVSDGRGSTTEKWNLHRFKMATAQRAAPIMLYANSWGPGTPRSTGHDPERLSIRSGALLTIGRQGDCAIVKTNDAGRLDAWSLKDRGKHIVGWKPYEKPEHVLWATALTPEIVLTLNTNGRLIRWKLPECKAVYERDFGPMVNNSNWPGLGIYLRPGLSPNHRHLAVWSGTTMLLVDTLAGKTHAVLGGTKPGGWLLPTFSPDGTKLACTEADNFTQVLVIYDLKTGAVLSRVPLPGDIWLRPANSETTFGGFTWVQDHYGVVGGKMMIDLDNGRPIWKFDTPALNSVNDPPAFTAAGPEFWYFSPQNPRSLNAVQLPHEAALEHAEHAPDSFAAGPGATVKVAIHVDANKEIQDALRGALLRRLEQLGMKLGSDSRVTLSLKSEIRDTGQQALVTTSRGRFEVPGDREEVKIQAIVLQTSFSVDGTEVWSRSSDFLPRPGDAWQPDPTKTTQEELLATQWNRVKTYAEGWLFDRIPGYVLDPKAQSSFPSGPYPTPQGPVAPR